MPAVDFDPLDPDMPGFEFGRFLFARPAGDSAICLFAQSDDLLLLVEYPKDQVESGSASFISDTGAQTVSDAGHLAVAGLLKPGESIREVHLADGSELLVAQKRPGWLAIADPLSASTTVTISVQTQTGIREKTLRIQI